MTHWLPKEQCNLQSGSNEASETWAGFLYWWNSQTDGSSHFHGQIFLTGQLWSVEPMDSQLLWALGSSGWRPSHNPATGGARGFFQPCLVSAPRKSTKVASAPWIFFKFKCWGCKKISTTSKASKSIKQHRNIPYCVKTVFGLDAHNWMNHTHLAHLSLMGCMLSRSVGEVLQESGEMLCGTQVGSSRALRDPSFLLPCARWRLVEQRHLHLWSFMHHSNFDWIKTQARQFASPSWCRSQLGGVRVQFPSNSHLPPMAIYHPGFWGPYDPYENRNRQSKAVGQLSPFPQFWVSLRMLLPLLSLHIKRPGTLLHQPLPGKKHGCNARRGLAGTILYGNGVVFPYYILRKERRFSL